jgi:8-oxo-dGTP diphosphatase
MFTEISIDPDKYSTCIYCGQSKAHGWIHKCPFATIMPLELPKATEDRYQKILVGVAVVVVNQDKQVLIAKRLDPNRGGFGKITVPGGVLNENELIEDAAKREVFEETGLVIQPFEINGSLVFHTKEHFESGCHCLTLYVAATIVSGVPTRKEPAKHSEWNWVSPEVLSLFITEGDEWFPAQKVLQLKNEGLI